MTPEGIKREQEVDRTQSVTHQTGRKINTLIIALLVLAIVVVAVDRLIPETTKVADTPAVELLEEKPAPDPSQLAAAKFTPAVENSIAVLPFASRSTREEDTYFVDGIHDDILTQLSKLSVLDKVISRTRPSSTAPKSRWSRSVRNWVSPPSSKAAYSGPATVCG